MGKEKRGLGTGLDVLFAANAFDEEESELLTLPLSKIEPRQEQPRERFDEAALQELADSIAQYGLIQPITVRRLDSGYYQIIAGERRWRASRLAGLTEVPVRVIEADDRRTAELALVENLQRQDLNPMEEARGYQSLMRDYGLTQEEAARSVGRSRPAVANALRLLSLSPKVSELVEKGLLSAGHARALLPLGSEALQLEAANEVIAKELSVRKTEQLAAKKLKEPRPEPEKDPLAVDYAAEVSDTLSRALGRKTRLVEARRGGRIEIEYSDAEDREALIELLSKIKK
ncbi:MAG: ParB/RepB/Spo0J family partition protein [Oscillospiraceae bacterium]|nr:ParB/RepB/Spo0J family partition protein [Oscillospiraceae bacterium]